MNNFEEDYKRHMEENTPDLWDRIEAGIDKKDKKKRLDYQSTKRLKVYLPLVAAALFLCIIIPVVSDNMSRHDIMEKSTESNNKAVAQDIGLADGAVLQEEAQLESITEKEEDVTISMDEAKAALDYERVSGGAQNKDGAKDIIENGVDKVIQSNSSERLSALCEIVEVVPQQEAQKTKNETDKIYRIILADSEITVNALVRTDQVEELILGNTYTLELERSYEDDSYDYVVVGVK